MKRYYLLIASVLVLGASCSGPGKNGQTEMTVQDSIVSMENSLFNDSGTQIKRVDAVRLIDLYKKYAKENPQDSLAPVYLFRAADISMNIQRPVRTIALFNKIMTEYPDYEKVSSIMFLKAFVYEDQLHDLDKAKRYYEEFLEKYPESDFADDAEVSLKNLGKTPEELIKEFEENNEQ